MSHVATIDIEVKDLDALGKACEELGLELVKDQKRYKWYGSIVGGGQRIMPEGFTNDDAGKCEHVIRVKGKPTAYEIGLSTRRDGRPGYALLWDTWSGGYGIVQAVGGEKAQKLVQSYAAEVATKAAKKAGFRVVKRSVRSDGSIQIVTQR